MNNWYKFKISSNGKRNKNILENWLEDCILEILDGYYIGFNQISVICKNNGIHIFCRILYEDLISRYPLSPVVIDVHKNTITGHYKDWMFEAHGPIESKLKIFNSKLTIPIYSKFIREKFILNNYINQLDVPLAQTSKVYYNTFLKLKQKYGFNKKFRNMGGNKENNVLINICKLPNELISLICNEAFPNNNKNLRKPNNQLF